MTNVVLRATCPRRDDRFLACHGFKENPWGGIRTGRVHERVAAPHLLSNVLDPARFDKFNPRIVLSELLITLQLMLWGIPHNSQSCSRMRRRNQSERYDHDIHALTVKGVSD